MANDSRTSSARYRRLLDQPVNIAPRAYAADHWLAWINVAVGLFVGLPFLAPILLARGQTEAANIIYAAFRFVCHQWAFRSYFLFGARPAYSIDELGALVGPERAFVFLSLIHI